MRALLFQEPNVMELATVEEKPLEPGTLRVQVKYAGICGTDLRIYRGVKHVSGPRVIGHEFVGTVAAVGPGAATYAVGERVVVYPMIVCNECYACSSGRQNICVNRKTIGYEIDGGFAEYVDVPAEAVSGGNVLRVPPNVSDQAAAVSEPVAAALNGIKRAGGVSGEDVLVMGGGPLGTAHIRLAHLLGAKSITLSEPQAERREAALASGASDAIDPSQLTDRYSKTGPGVVFVDVGVPTLVAEASNVARKGATVVIFAGMPVGSRIELDPNLIHYREVDIVGSSGSTPELQAEVLTHAADGRLDIESLVSHVLPLHQWRSGFEMKQEAAGMKVLLDMET